MGQNVVFACSGKNGCFPVSSTITFFKVVVRNSYHDFPESNNSQTCCCCTPEWRFYKVVFLVLIGCQYSDLFSCMFLKKLESGHTAHQKIAVQILIILFLLAWPLQINKCHDDGYQDTKQTRTVKISLV